MSDSTTAVVVQARTSSRRLPGKVLMPLAGAPAIVRMMERVARASRASFRVVATSVEPSDDALAEVCQEHAISCVRGPLDDVLARIVAAVPPQFCVVVRLTGDCPLVDPDLVDRHIECFERERGWVEYATNSVVRTYPHGLDVEVVTREMLLRADREARSAEDREHVLTWVRRRARTLPVTQETDLSLLRWTMDTAADYEAIAAIYEELYPGKPDFATRDVYRLLLRRPELIHVEGSTPPDRAERARWTARIEAHLAAPESGC